MLNVTKNNTPLYGIGSQTGNVDDDFSITAEGGVLYTRGTLDRETRASYLLSIQARDSAGANSLSSVTQVRVCRSVHV